MRYQCIKGFSVNKYDDNGFLVENEYENIEIGSVWETGDADNRSGFSLPKGLT